MAMLIRDCARCGERKMTHDFLYAIKTNHADFWTDKRFEGLIQCRACLHGTVISLRQAASNFPDPLELVKTQVVVDQLVTDVQVIRPITSALTAPEHTPQALSSVFNEGAECLAIGCTNAAASMFRKVLDVVSKSAIPTQEFFQDAQSGVVAPTKRERFNLKDRLAYLYRHGLLPKETEPLADCIREDGNDAVHDHPITEAEALDIQDFTIEMLESIYTLPGRLAAAKERREKRREDIQK